MNGICIFALFYVYFCFLVCISFAIPYTEHHFLSVFVIPSKKQHFGSIFESNHFLSLVGLFLIHLNHILLIPFHGMKYTIFMRTRIMDSIEVS